MKQDDRRKPVTIEDLLRVKRAEKPDREFWDEWELRFRDARTQAALEPRHWWREAIPQLGIALARWYVPVGATAVLALTFFAVREYSPSVPLNGSGARAAFADSATTNEDAKAASADLLGELRQNGQGTLLTPSAYRPGEISRMVSGIDDADSLSPTERAIAANLAAMRAIEPELAAPWSGRVLRHAASANALQDEPLAGIAAARELRRGRYLGYGFQNGAASELPVSYSRQQERVISRLGEDQLYEVKIRSVGAKGDRLSVRF